MCSLCCRLTQLIHTTSRVLRGFFKGLLIIKDTQYPDLENIKNLLLQGLYMNTSKVLLKSSAVFKSVIAHWMVNIVVLAFFIRIFQKNLF